jgi:hypothetical protein
MAAVDVVLLGDVGEHVVATMAIDEDEFLDSRAGQGGADVGDHGDEGGGADADCSGEAFVFVGAAERDRWEDEYRIGGEEFGGEEAGDRGVGDEGQVVAVLFEAADRQDRDRSAAGGFVGRCGGGHQLSHRPVSSFCRLPQDCPGPVPHAQPNLVGICDGKGFTGTNHCPAIRCECVVSGCRVRVRR